MKQRNNILDQYGSENIFNYEGRKKSVFIEEKNETMWKQRIDSNEIYLAKLDKKTKIKLEMKKNMGSWNEKKQQ